VGEGDSGRAGDGELIAVDAATLAEVEAFLARATGHDVRLGRVRLAAGPIGAVVARLARASGITFGSVICLESRLGARVRERGGAPLDVLGSLLVHECTHVWQYRRDGWVRFLANYLRSYFTNLLELHSLGRSARSDAYRAIPAEREAYGVEFAWRLEQEARAAGFPVPAPADDDVGSCET
jgi:hypothetical protein